jgi:mono/diheme cytochrome c family protein
VKNRNLILAVSAAVIAGCAQIPPASPVAVSNAAPSDGSEAHAAPDEPTLPSFIADAYRPRETNPAAVARGWALFQEYACNFCHGADIRGAAGGPSLLRSQLVQRDQNGELIGDVIRNGVPGTTMAAFALNADQIRDIAEFLHSFPLSSRDPARVRPESIVTGDAQAGRRYFTRSCSGCHSVTGDLAGIASRITDPRELQQTWLMPDNAPPVLVNVASADAVISGALVRIDEFSVTLELPSGMHRTFRRDGVTPAVTLEDPLQAHRDLLPQYADRDIHNVTAYLVTIE